MAWKLALVGLDLRPVAFIRDYERFTLRRRQSGFAELDVFCDSLNKQAQEARVGERILRLYRDETPIFGGKVWEPLEQTSQRITIKARDPFAEFEQRRVRAGKDYAAADAGDILLDRVAIQNGYANTFLRALSANRDTSVNRTRSYDPGKLERDIVSDLIDADQGFFFRVEPVEGVAGVLGDLYIDYPDAGTTREGVRFEYGEGTLGNCLDYSITDRLPVNRFTAATGGSSGGRIAKVAEDADSVTRYGLFENETTFSDVADTLLLEQHAKAELKPDAQRTISFKPAPDAPKLLTDFFVGDFVRARIFHAGHDLFEWVRVASGALTVDSDGVETPEDLTLELVVGGRAIEPPERIWLRRRDEDRRRREAIERKVQNISASETAPGDAPAPFGGSGGGGPADTESPVLPPDAPSPPPIVSSVAVFSTLPTSIGVQMQADGNGSDTEVFFVVKQGGSIVAITNAVVGGSGFIFHQESIGGLTPGTSYTVRAVARSAGGDSALEAGFSTPLTGPS